MSKSKKQLKKPANKVLSLPAHIVEIFERATASLDAEEFDDALTDLLRVQEERPDFPGIDFMLAGVAGVTHNYDILEKSLRRMVAAEPREIDFQFRLGAAYLLNGRLGLGYSVLSNLLEAYPGHPDCDVYRNMVESIAEEVESELAETGLPRSEALEFHALADDVHYYVAEGQINRALDLVDRMVRRWPKLGKACQLHAMACFNAERLEEAVVWGKRAAELLPNEVEARTHLVQFLTVSGYLDEAKAQAAVIPSICASTDYDVRQSLFALAMVADFAHAVELYERYRTNLPDIENDPILLHIAAGSYAFLGREEDARRLWRKALEINPSFKEALDNLDDLDRNPGYREGPFVFRSSALMTASAISDVLDMSYSLDLSADATARAARKILRKHPELIRSTPHILRNAHELTADLLCDLAVAARDPSYLALFTDFISGSRYSDYMRRKHAVSMFLHGELTAESIPFWSEGVYRAEVSVAQIMQETVGVILKRDKKLSRIVDDSPNFFDSHSTRFNGVPSADLLPAFTRDR